VVVGDVEGLAEVDFGLGLSPIGLADPHQFLSVSDHFMEAIQRTYHSRHWMWFHARQGLSTRYPLGSLLGRRRPREASC
jgi:hypothetical protein